MRCHCAIPTAHVFRDELGQGGRAALADQRDARRARRDPPMSAFRNCRAATQLSVEPKNGSSILPCALAEVSDARGSAPTRDSPISESRTLLRDRAFGENHKS